MKGWLKHMKKYWSDDPDGDVGDPKAAVQVMVPPDLEAADKAGPAPAETAQVITTNAFAPGVDITQLSDEALEAELGRRRASSLDLRIAELANQLSELQHERDRLLGLPTSAPTPAAVTVPPRMTFGHASAEQDYRPIPKPSKIKPGSLPHEKCDCRLKGLDGCYKCMVVR